MMQISIVRILKVLTLSLSVFMIWLVYDTSMKSNMFQLPSSVVNEPWFQTTLVDFYFNITLISIWLFYKERKVVISIVWLIAFILLGSIATSFYVFLQLNKLKTGDSLEKLFVRE